MQSNAKTVAAYLADLSIERRRPLARLRTLIKRAAPRAHESMKHGMPTYELDGPLFAFAAQKHYFALYVSEAQVLAANIPKLGNIAPGKSCVRFKTAAELDFAATAQMLREAAAARAG
jgi:uncharacterized protein YdhG (YjbR/CyaY superfamily)